MAERDTRPVLATRFVGKTILITGAAGDIGATTARRFSSEGCNLVLVDLAGEVRMKSLAEELSGSNKGKSSALVVVCDVRDRKQVDALFRSACERFGRVDFVFNNAGIQGPFQPADEYDEEHFRKVLDVDVFGVFVVMKAAAEAMKKEDSPGGVIVNTASLAGVLGPPNMIAYAAAKHAVVGMTRTGAKDLARHGIRVCAIAPGLLEGCMWDNQVRNQAKCRKSLESGVPLDSVEVDEDDTAAQCARMISSTAMKRLGALDEVASVVSFLCSADASYLTGNVITIDGGKFC